MNLVLPHDVLQSMLDACQHSYPEECCGALLGVTTDLQPRTVTRVLPIVNQRDSERRTRYLIGPEAFRDADAHARAHDLEIIGFYHSHPDHPAVPSTFDREHAWPWYVYVIVPVAAGRPAAPRAWRLTDDRARFDEVTITHPT